MTPDDLQHNHTGPPDDTQPTCPVCHYPGWEADEAYEAQRLQDLAASWETARALYATLAHATCRTCGCCRVCGDCRCPAVERKGQP